MAQATAQQTGFEAIATPAEILCAHCSEPVSRNSDADDASLFCCRGCETVSGILRLNGLSDYYRLRETTPVKWRPVPSNESYAYLDDGDYQAANGIANGKIRLYLEGVHCAACIWLVEKLPQLSPGVESATLDLGRGIATVQLARDGSFAPAAETLASLGYRPHAVKPGEDHPFEKLENRRSVIRIGVAGACGLNLMMMAVALYSGVADGWSVYFRWASFAFYLPVLFYSAAPFFQSAWKAWQWKRLSIDVPIVIGITGGTAAGVYNLFAPTLQNEIYFDSLAVLIFLLLSSRFLVRRAQQKALASVNFIRQLMPLSTRRWNETAARFDTVAVEAIKAGDLIEVKSGEVIPADGVIERGQTELNLAMMTGESRLHAVAPGADVHSGSVNTQAPIEIRVRVAGAASRLGQISELVHEAAASKTGVVAMADRISGWFTGIVVVVGALIFAYWLPQGFQIALNNSMALFIVTCPCALAMSAPVAMLVSMSRLARRGIVLKDPSVLERVTRARTVFLDKTGTLTEGKLRVLGWDWIALAPVSEIEIKQAVYELERKASHAIATALVDELVKQEFVSRHEVTFFHEKIGHGVSGVMDGKRFEISRVQDWIPPVHKRTRTQAAFAGKTDLDDTTVQSAVSVHCDGVAVATIRLGDRLRDDAAEAVRFLEKHGMTPHLLSGDTAAPVLQTARRLSIAADRTRAECRPEDKWLAVTEIPNAILIGDGANDAAALAAASVGIAVHGGMEISMKVADVYLRDPGLRPVRTLITASHETLRVVYRNLAFSAVYNVIGATAAAMGLMSPLFAAVLMPISSLTILSSSIWGAKSLR